MYNFALVSNFTDILSIVASHYKFRTILYKIRDIFIKFFIVNVQINKSYLNSISNFHSTNQYIRIYTYLYL